MESTATTASSSSTDSAVAPPAKCRWMGVVLMQSEEADALLDIIDRNGPESATHHLSLSDDGDETRDAALVNGYIHDAIPQSPTDGVIRDNASEYALTFNHHFRYVSLPRHFDPDVVGVGDAVALPARFRVERERAVRRTNAIRL